MSRRDAPLHARGDEHCSARLLSFRRRCIQTHHLSSLFHEDSHRTSNLGIPLDSFRRIIVTAYPCEGFAALRHCFSAKNLVLPASLPEIVPSQGWPEQVLFTLTEVA